MKNVIIIGVAAVLLFGVSAGLSLWMSSPTAKRTEEDSKTSSKMPRGLDNQGEKGSGTTAPKDTPPLSPAVSSSTSSGTDQITQAFNQLQARITSLDQRELSLKEREKRMAMILEDIQSSRETVDSLRKAVSDELQAVNDKVRSMDQKRTSLDDHHKHVSQKLDDMMKKRIPEEKAEQEIISQEAAILDNMEADKAARIFKIKADSGNMETAVKILGKMKERKAAEVLAAMEDLTLAAQLLEKLTGLRRGQDTPQTPPGL